MTNVRIAVWPENSPLVSAVANAVKALGELVRVSVDTEVVVLDLHQPFEIEKIRRAAPQALLVGVGSFDSALCEDVFEVISPEAVAKELPARIERARKYQKTRLESIGLQRDAKMLLELTSLYTEANDVNELFHDVTRKLADEMSIDRVALIVVDSETEATIIAASDDASLNQHVISLARYPEIKEVLRTGKPVILDNAASHPLLEDVKVSVAAKGIRSIAALPLTSRGNVMGVMLLRRFTSTNVASAFTPREVEFLSTAAHATAVAFRNLRQLERVTGQRETEKSARLKLEEQTAALKRYSDYFHHLSDGVAILDSETRVLSLNPAGLRLFDLTALPSHVHINTLAPSSDEALWEELLYSVSRGNTRSDVEIHIKTGLKRRVILSISAAPLASTEGVAILTLRDVTRQRQMADDLRQTTDFLERLIDSSVDAIIASDMRGKILLFNKSAEAVTGYSASNVIGRMHVTALYPDGLAKDIMRRLRSDEFGGKGRLTTSRAEIVSKKGDIIPVNMTASIVTDGERELATVGLFTDLRDRLNLERRLTDAEAKLIESEKTAVLVALAGTAAHELNQPLTSVMGYSELLKRKLNEKDVSYRAVDIIHREAERMAEIVKKIGKITRFETKSYVGASRIVDLDKAVSHEE
jgi:PAS domain S-box-containing protein